MAFPMTHYHYDRFDTPDDERFGKWSVNFSTEPAGGRRQGPDVARRSRGHLRAPAAGARHGRLKQLAGTYETPTGSKFQVLLKEDGGLFLLFAGQPEQRLVPTRA
jgi:hypothetical protein